MGLFHKLFGRRVSESAAPAAEEMITAYDAYGRRLEIPREEWRRNVLPTQLRAAWSSANDLYTTLASALADGFASELGAAAQRLHAIDSDRERGACMLAIVQLENDQTNEAMLVLAAALRDFPHSAPLLTNLARAQHKLNDGTWRTTLWSAITADPNYDHALLWYTAAESERGGEAAYLDAMRRAAALDGSWRANIWLAQNQLQRQELGAARALYEKVLVVAADQPGVLLQISGDLGKAGFASEIVPLIRPFYDPQRHDVVAGFNLLQAYIETGDWRGGEALLHELMLLDLPPYREQLFWYSSKFEQMKSEPPMPENVADDIQVEGVRLDIPVWLSGLGEATWLLPAKSSLARTIAVLALANTTSRGELMSGEALVGREDAIGRWTRAIPLYLSDTLRFRTDAKPVTLMQVVKGRGMMVIGREWTADDLRDIEAGSHVISGSIALHGDDVALDLALWERGAPKPLERFRGSGAVDALATTYLGCESELLRCLREGGIADANGDGELLQVPSDHFREYIDGLGQVYAIALAAQDRSPSLYGERHIHRWLLDLALAMPAAPIPKIALLSTLANSRRRGSRVYRELERGALALFAGVQRSDAVVYRLTPFVFRLFDHGTEFESRRNELMMDGGDDYVRWLAGLESTFAA